jgi:hypothetical protein
MIDDSIGIIGNIQGVNAKKSPNIKNSNRIKNELSLTSTSAILAVLPSLVNLVIFSRVLSPAPV